MIVMRSIMLVYAVLMLLTATTTLIKEEDKGLIINIIASLLIGWAVFFAIWSLFKTLAIIVILIYQILAIYRGVSKGYVHWNHHIIRGIISIVLIILLLIIK